MGSTYNEEDIIRKIMGLLATSDSLEESNPEASASYAQKAQELIQKYNIEQARLRKERGESPVNTSSMIYKVPGDRTWQIDLLHVLTKCNFCKIIRVSGTRNVWIFGDQITIDACLILFKWILAQIKTLADTGYVEYQIECMGEPEKDKVWKYNFSIGASCTVRDRLFQQFEEVQKQQAEVRALIVVNSNAIEETIQKQLKGRVTPGRRRNYRLQSQAGLREGMEAGKSIHINRQVK